MSLVESASTSPTSAGGRVPWFELLAPPVAWASQLLVATAAVGEACANGNPSTGRAVGASVSLLALMVTAGCGIVATRRLLRISGAPVPGPGEASGRFDLTALGAASIGVVFTLALVWAALPLLVFADVCRGER